MQYYPYLSSEIPYDEKNLYKMNGVDHPSNV